MLKKLSYHTSTPPFEIIKRMNVIPLTFTKIIPNSANPLKISNISILFCTNFCPPKSFNYIHLIKVFMSL